MNTLTLLPGDAEHASKLLTQGELVALPTDTVYGLAAVPGLEDAVKKVYEVKSRPLDKALLLLVSDPDALDKFCSDNGLSHENLVYVGDDYGPGGNDESVYLSDFRFICVDDYTKLGEYLKELL